MSRLRAVVAGLPLDCKLGFRMLLKYPGLTIVAGLAMAFALWFGAVTFELTTLFLRPTLPLPDGERIVQLRNWDVAASSAEPRALHDFRTWQQALSSVADLGAYRDLSANLIVNEGDARPVTVAETTATAFRIAPQPPLLGRVLSAADQRPGAPPVVVLGHELWRTRFDADPEVLGRSVRLGASHATVVGVMPQGFAFPVAHELWTPLTTDLLEQAPRSGPAIQIFGRLTPGATLQHARSELAALGRRMAAEHPESHRHLQPQVAPYAQSYDPPDAGSIVALYSILGFALLLLLLVASNVALLLFARTASREGELLVRSALGASRGRISAQLFTEALVLGGVAAAAGLGAAHVALELWAGPYLQINLGQLPFWMVPALSPTTVLYVLALTVLAALVAGLLPALKMTRAFGIGKRLRQASAGAGGLQFGGVWTVVIVLQVAVSVAFPAAVLVVQGESRRISTYDVGFPAGEYLGVLLQRDGSAMAADDAAAAAQRDAFAATLEALRQQVAAEPGVAGVTFVDKLPRSFHPEWRMELDDGVAGSHPAAASATAQAALGQVAVARVDPSYFAVLGAPALAGRGFHAGDLAPEARTVVVDQGFVDQVLQGRNPVGQRVRFAVSARGDGQTPQQPNPWYEIVGVVKGLGMDYVTHRMPAAGLYLPTRPGTDAAVWMVVHAPVDPLALVPRIHSLAGAVDPTLRLAELQRLDQVTDDLLWFLGLWQRISLALSAIALLLSLAGIYSILSFTVARRTREIGVRVALGASGTRIAAQIFRRPLLQVTLGVVAGSALIGLAAVALLEQALSPGQLALLLAYALLMLGVCLLACVVPTRRALRIQATEALRAE